MGPNVMIEEIITTGLAFDWLERQATRLRKIERLNLRLSSELNRLVWDKMKINDFKFCQCAPVPSEIKQTSDRRSWVKVREIARRQIEFIVWPVARACSTDCVRQLPAEERLKHNGE